MTDNFHTAAALIVSAAEKSGLLDDVAEALLFIDKRPIPEDDRAGAIRDYFAGRFNEHICTPASIVEDFHGDGIAIGPFTKDEIAPFLGTAGGDSELIAGSAAGYEAKIRQARTELGFGPPPNEFDDPSQYDDCA
jgi:hypothetical protein